jgi:hypothetical protein
MALFALNATLSDFVLFFRELEITTMRNRFDIKRLKDLKKHLPIGMNPLLQHKNGLTFHIPCGDIHLRDGEMHYIKILIINGHSFLGAPVPE